MAGSEDDIPPPPPPPSQTPTQQTPHTVSTIKLPILKKGEYDIWAMKMEHYLAHTDYPIWEVIQRGNGPVSVSTDTNGLIKVLPPKTAEEILARKRERKAKTSLLMALPEDHLAKFHKMTDAKEMWEAIKSRFGVNDESKKMQKYILKQQFEGFSISNSKGLHKGYDMFQSLLSQLEIHDAGVSTEDANQKFLRSLPSAWSQVSLIMRTKPGVDSLSFDDLYNNLRVFESDVKGSTASSSSTQNVAFVSENTSSTNDVSTAYGVSNSSGHNSQYEHTSSYSLLANQSSCPQLDHEDLEQLDEFDLEEMDLKWQVAMISMRMKKFYKKTGRKLQFDAKEPVGFDKTKVECYSCHKTGHFARECRSKGNQDSRRRDAWNTGNKDKDNGRRSGKQEDSKALVTLDGEGVDWTSHSEDEQENYTLMSCNSSGSDTEREQLGDASIEIYRTSDIEDSPVNDRYAEGMHTVPPQMTGIYIPSGPDKEINDSQFTYGPKQSKPSESDARSNRQYHTNAARKVNTVKPIVNNARPKAFSAVGGKGKLLLSPQQVVIGDTKDITGTKSPNTMVDQVLEIITKGLLIVDVLIAHDHDKRPTCCDNKTLMWPALLLWSEMCDKKNKDYMYCQYGLLIPSTVKSSKAKIRLKRQRTRWLIMQAEALRNVVCQRYWGFSSQAELSKAIITNTLILAEYNTISNTSPYGDYRITWLTSTNLETYCESKSIPQQGLTLIHPSTLILGDPNSAVQTRSKVTKSSRAYAFKISEAFEDEIWVDAMHEELLQFKIQKVWILVDLPMARIEAIRIFLAFDSYKGFIVYQMDVKSAFPYVKIDEEVYVSQPPGFVDPKYPNKVYKVGNSLWFTPSSPGAWYITAKVDGKPVSISEALIRSNLLFDDADGIDSLPNQAIFDAIQLMGYVYNMETEDAQDVGRTSYVVHEEKESAKKGVNTKDPLSTTQPKVSTNKPEHSTDKPDEEPRPTSTKSLLTLKPLPKIDPKDKGKKIIEKEDESDTDSEDITEAEKKFKQLAKDEEVARKVQEDWEAEEEVKTLAEEEATKAALSKKMIINSGKT
ncbi:ribonuclease H-like domain-containing protein [Tanacetum coccineum]|uniref:Ribonuclease H-like domain-containing protein n=1 Tax=Tanacetum coccineum TaxID=301880 RepID=A0ABQ4Z2X8_9ASTR